MLNRKQKKVNFNSVVEIHYYESVNLNNDPKWMQFALDHVRFQNRIKYTSSTSFD